MKPYCGERSMEYLCDYVQGLIYISEIMDKQLREHCFESIKGNFIISEFAVRYANMQQAYRRLIE